MTTYIPVRASTAELIARHARSVAFDGTHQLHAPAASWLLLALGARAATGTTRRHLEAALGTDAPDAAARAATLLATGHPGVTGGLGVWADPAVATPAFAAFARTLPVAVRGRIPTRAHADAWCAERTGGQLAAAPLTLTGTALALLGVTATTLDWLAPVPVHPADTLGGFTAGCEGVLGWGAADTVAVHDTGLGPVAVHTRPAASGLTLHSVLGPPGTAPTAVLAAALDVALGASEPIARTELPATGPGWRLEPAGDRSGDAAWLPAWRAETSWRLDDTPGIAALTAALDALLDDPTAPGEAVLTATARCTARGTIPGPPTVLGVRTVPAAGSGTPRLTLHFDRPYAVVVTAGPRLARGVPGTPTREQPGPAWHGLPVQLGWITEPSDAGPVTPLR